RVHAAFTAKTGLELRSGCEPEMMWTGPGFEARFRPGSSLANHVEHLERYRAIYQKVIAYAQALGLDMIEGDYEDPSHTQGAASTARFLLLSEQVVVRPEARPSLDARGSRAR
ncbi:MAG TPA: hypothetical protein VH594_22445, partial [Trebonia sp.]